MVCPLQEGGMQGGSYPHSLGDSDGGALFFIGHQDEPSGELRCSGHYLAGLWGEIFFSSLIDE